MNVNGLTGPSRAPAGASPSSKTRKAGGMGTPGAVVKLSTVGTPEAIRLVADRSMKRILEMTQTAAQKLGVDPATFDPSPDAVSSMIADFAIGLYSVYRRQHPEMDDATALSEYETMIKKAVNTGYQEALGVLHGMQIDSEDILAQAQRTIDLTFAKLDHFFESARADLGVA